MAFDIEKAREFSRTYPNPKSVCTCGHSGDGDNSNHATVVAPGHGMCLVEGCGCPRFTWAGRTLSFQHALDEYAGKAE